MIDIVDVVENWKTIDVYAKESNLTYEAVRKKVVRYRADLEGHIVKWGRKQYLDPYAIEFLEEKRDKKSYFYKIREDYLTFRNMVEDKNWEIRRKDDSLQEIKNIATEYVSRNEELNKVIDSKDETIQFLKEEISGLKSYVQELEKEKNRLKLKNQELEEENNSLKSSKRTFFNLK